MKLTIYLLLFTELLNSQILSTRTASEEAMTVLEEIIMFTFQQTVYYLTRVSTHSYTHILPYIHAHTDQLSICHFTLVFHI